MDKQVTVVRSLIDPLIGRLDACNGGLVACRPFPLLMLAEVPGKYTVRAKSLSVIHEPYCVLLCRETYSSGAAMLVG